MDFSFLKDQRYQLLDDGTRRTVFLDLAGQQAQVDPRFTELDDQKQQGVLEDLWQSHGNVPRHGIAKEAAYGVGRGVAGSIGGVAQGVQAVKDLVTGEERPTTEGELYQWGQGLHEKSQEAMPASRDNFGVRVAEGVGSMATFITTGGLARAGVGLAGRGALAARGLSAAEGARKMGTAKQLAGYSVAFPQAGFAGTGEAYNRALEAEMTEPERRAHATKWGFPSGMVQVANIGLLFRPLPNPLKPSAAYVLGRRMAEAGISEFTVENAGAVIQNLGQQVYDPDHPIWDDVPEQGLTAGSASMLLQALMLPMVGRKVGKRQFARPEDAPPVLTPEGGAFATEQEARRAMVAEDIRGYEATQTEEGWVLARIMNPEQDAEMLLGQIEADLYAGDATPEQVRQLDPSEFGLDQTAFAEMLARFETAEQTIDPLDQAMASAQQVRGLLEFEQQAKIHTAMANAPGSALPDGTAVQARQDSLQREGRETRARLAQPAPQYAPFNIAPETALDALEELPINLTSGQVIRRPAEGGVAVTEPRSPATVRKRTYKTEKGALLSLKSLRKAGVVDNRYDVFQDRDGFRIRTRAEGETGTAELQTRARQIRQEQDELVRANPVYAAVQEARSAPLNLEAFKRDYDTETVKEITRKFPGIFAKNGKMQPDEFAADQGFDGLDAFVETLKATPAMKNARGQIAEQGQEADALAARGFEVTGKPVAVDSLEAGDRFILDGREYIHAGYQKNGDAFFWDQAGEEGFDFSADVFSRLEVAAVKPGRGRLAAEELVGRREQDDLAPDRFLAAYEKQLPSEHREAIADALENVKKSGLHKRNPQFIINMLDGMARSRVDTLAKEVFHEQEGRVEKDDGAAGRGDRRGDVPGVVPQPRPGSAREGEGETGRTGEEVRKEVPLDDPEYTEPGSLAGPHKTEDLTQDRLARTALADFAAKASANKAPGFIRKFLADNLRNPTLGEVQEKFPAVVEGQYRNLLNYNGKESFSIASEMAAANGEANSPGNKAVSALLWKQHKQTEAVENTPADASAPAGVPFSVAAAPVQKTPETDTRPTESVKKTPAAPAETQAEPVTPPPSKAETKAEPGKIEDFGEKIGGARKDLAERGTPGAKKKSESSEPSWRKKFIVLKKVKGDGWVIARKGDMFARGDAQVFTTEAEAEKAIPLYAVASLFSPSQESNGTWEVYKRVGDRKRLKMTAQQFASREEAMKYMAINAEPLLAAKTSFGEEILPLPDKVVRKGAARRKGDVTSEMFNETFAPRGIEFGNWNNQAERQLVMNHAYDGLLDLAEALDLPPKALMLNGELAIAFGARGQGLVGAKAHYEPGYGVINFTKMKGAGSLAHEWMHALDHYLARLDTKAKSEKIKNKRGDLVYEVRDGKYTYQSHGPSYRSEMRAELKEAYNDLIKGMLRKAEQYVEDTKVADKFLSAARQHLREQLDTVREGLATDYATRYTWRKVKKGLHPASAEQLAEFDRLADTLVEGGNLELETKSVAPKNRSGFGWTYRSNETLDALNEIYKAVRNRSGFAKDGGALDRIAANMRTYGDRIRMLNDAQAGTEKTKTVPTNFAIEARKMDQARAGDYWSHPHEMAARAFAAYAEDKIAAAGGQSEFLVYHAHGGILLPMIDGFVARPYPEGKERQAINKAFDKFVGTIKTRETEKGVALYSEGQKPVKPAHLEKEIADRLGQKRWGKLLDSGKVKVVEFQKDLPFSTTGMVQGAYQGGKVWLVAENIGEGESYGVLLHELGEHARLPGLLGKRYADLLRQVEKLSTTDPAMIKARSMVPKDTHKLAVPRETLAYYAQETANQKLPFFKKLLSIVRAWGYRWGLPLNLQPADMRMLVEGAMRQGKEKDVGAAIERRKGQEELETLLRRGAEQFSQRPELSLKAAVKKITDNPAFVKWFGKSVVTVDSKPGGEPLVVYHGTGHSEIASFKPGDIGIHFGTTTQASQVAANRWGTPSVYPVYVAIKNPIRLTDMGAFDASEVVPQLQDMGILPETVFPDQFHGADGNAAIRTAIKKAGYDGVVYLNRREGQHDPFGPDGVAGNELDAMSDADVMEMFPEAEDSYIAFDPTQIKSIFNEKFDAADPRILFSQAADGTLDPKAAAYLKKLQSLYLKSGKVNEPKGVRLIDKYESLIKTLKDDKVDIYAKQQALEAHIKKHLPLEARWRVLHTIKNIAKPTTKTGREKMLEKGIEQAEAAHQKWEKQSELLKVKKLLKKKAPKKTGKGVQSNRGMGPDANTLMAKVRRAFGLTQADGASSALEILQVLDKEGRGPTQAEAEQLVTLQMFAGLAEKTTPEIIKARETLEEIIGSGRMELHIAEAARKEKMTGLRDSALEEFTGGEGLKSTERERLERSRAGLWRKLADNWRSYDDMHQSFEFLLDKLTRFDTESQPLKGKTTEHFARLALEAHEKGHDGVQAHQGMLAEKLSELYGVSGRKLARVLQQNTVSQEKTGVTRDTKHGRVEIPLSQNQAYKLWQMHQQPSIQAEMQEHGYDATTLRQLEKYLEPKVKKWAAWQLDEFFPTYREGVNEVYKRLFYVEMPQIDKYSPISRVYHGQTQDEALLGEGGGMMTSPLAGAVKSRTQNMRDFNILDGDAVLLKHIVELEHFKAWGEPMREMRSVLGAETIQAAVKQYHGPTANAVLKKLMDDFASGGVDRSTTLGGLDKIRANFTRAVIGGNPVVFLKQLSSIPAYAMEIPAKDFAKGVVYALSHPTKVYKTLMESKTMQARYNVGFERDVMLAMQRNTVKSVSGTRTLSDLLMLSTKLGDKLAIMTGGWSVYDYHLKRLTKEGKGKAEAHKEALYQFDRATKRSQQAGDTMDLAHVQRMGSLGKMFTMFMTAPLAYYRNTAAGLRNLAAGRGSRAENAKRVFISWVMLQMIFQWVASGFEWEEDKMARAALMGPLNGLFIVRDVLGTMMAALFEGTTYFSAGTPPPLTTANLGAQAMKRANKLMAEGWDDAQVLKMLDELAEVAGNLTGVPYGPLTRVGSGLRDAASGETDHPVRRALGYSERNLSKD